MNDAIAIVIFRSVKNFVIEANTGLTSYTLFLILLDFVKLLLLSVFVGLAIGLLTSLLFKKYVSFN